MKKLSTKYLLILVLVVDLVLCGSLLGKALSKKESARNHISDVNIQSICELAALECYYHNATDWEQPGYGVFRYGEKKIWIEYDGIVRVGIDAGKVKISEPDKNDVITVTVPSASILEIDLDEQSMQEISSDRTVLFFFTDQVNTEDRKKALAAAQEDMKNEASNNEKILTEARERAKKIIERNLLAAGEAGGRHYTVKFADASEAQSSGPAEE